MEQQNIKAKLQQMVGMELRLVLELTDEQKETFLLESGKQPIKIMEVFVK